MCSRRIIQEEVYKRSHFTASLPKAPGVRSYLVGNKTRVRVPASQSSELCSITTTTTVTSRELQRSPQHQAQRSSDTSIELFHS
jgi:hypothetical protein